MMDDDDRGSRGTRSRYGDLEGGLISFLIEAGVVVFWVIVAAVIAALVLLVV